ncbi:peptide synthetase [Photobacterium frigidiphilum]|uniref:Peptide synthetase n=1 Tax=Photobacterium frigidiphilum TaxID=264736 RepID=A0A2T3J8V1_9GAMM|nr:amino acid adenylation domain-containing protein [Photobacterium frigidiphilum]PSU45229.1 peptide synthetase [Photobacterium frigidiphilum]
MQADCLDSCLDAAYWKTLFAGVTEPTHFSANKAGTAPLEQRVANTDTFTQLLTHNLSPEWVAMFNVFCVDANVDCSTLFSASWNWMLYQYSGESVVTSGMCDIPCKTVIPTVQSFSDRSLTVAAWLCDAQAQLSLSKQMLFHTRLNPTADLQPLNWLTSVVSVKHLVPPLDNDDCPNDGANDVVDNNGTLMPGTIASVYIDNQDSFTGWRVQLAYSEVHFSVEQASSLLEDWIRLLMGICQQRWSTVNELCVGQWLSSKDASIGPISDLPSPSNTFSDELASTLLAALQHAAQHERTAIEWQGGTLSYTALLQRVAEIQHLLHQHNIECGDRVGLHVYRQPDMISAMIASLLSGVTFVPLEPTFPADRLVTIEQEAGLKAILQDTALSIAIPMVPFKGANVVLLAAENVMPISGLMPRVCDGLSSDTPAYIMFTSGSTGKPKGVVITHRALLTFLQGSTDRLELDAATRWLLITTMAFDIALLEIFAPLWVGGCAVLMSSDEYRDPHAISDYLTEDNAITVMQATPAFWRMLLNTGWQGNQQLVALCGGEALDKPLAEQLVLRTQRLWNCYGPTEATVWSLMAEITADALNLPSITLQHSLIGYTHQVVDADLQPVSVNMVGELCIQGEALSHGYWQRDDLTAQQFVTLSPHQVRSYRTGDKVRVLGDDCYQYLGRFDDQVKLRGFRIELGEIEAQLKYLTMVKDAAVKLIGKGDEAQLVAFMEMTKDTRLSKLAVRKVLLKTLPSYMVPNRFVVLEQLPKTGSGKVDRKQLYIKKSYI